MNESPFLDGFAGLQAIFDQKMVASAIVFTEPVFERLRAALANPGSRSPLDLAVLIRHALGYEDSQRHSEGDATLQVPIGSYWPNDVHWQKVGLNAQRHLDHWHVRFKGWRPVWLPNNRQQSVDWAVVGEEERLPLVATNRLLSDVFLSQVGVKTYRSQGQCRAARALLTAPPGATLMVTLPTGEGKSLLFQLIDRVGFYDSHQKLGVTLVIVPTITLAIDHEQSARKLPPLPNRPADQPLAYIGDDDLRRNMIREAIRSGQQGLCFASPEAACGSLRSTLLAAASAGYLRALVVDEAHLVEGWGTDFRTDFQLLGGLWAEVMDCSPVAQKPRTLLLSATLTPIAVQALQQFFADSQTPFTPVGTIRLRPEIEFWFGSYSDVLIRQERCLEALAHLPRPAIFYTTKVIDAENWYNSLRDFGYHALHVMTGNTKAEERERVLETWRNGEVDLVVATAAFGMGVDYAHVRTVVHACIPETLDRFYQEVGRSGRDRRASISLLLPAYEDIDIASSLNQKTIISVDRGFTRWRSLFKVSNSLPVSDPRERIINLNTPPSLAPDDINMLGILNTDWNARTLALMARAGLIQLKGSISSTEVPTEYAAEALTRSLQKIRLLNDKHYEKEYWQQMIESLRQAIYHHNRSSLHHLLSVVRGNTCMARVAADLYTLHSSNKVYPATAVCAGCAWCRAHSREHTLPEPVRSLPIVQWQSLGLQLSAAGLFDSRNLALVFYQRDELTQRRSQRRLMEAIEQLISLGLLRLIGIGGGLSLIQGEQIEKLACRVVFLAKIDEFLQLSTLNTNMPNGPELLFIGENVNLPSTILEARPDGQERLLLLPTSQLDPGTPWRLLRNICAVPSYSVDDFIGNILS